MLRKDEPQDNFHVTRFFNTATNNTDGIIHKLVMVFAKHPPALKSGQATDRNIRNSFTVNKFTIKRLTLNHLQISKPTCLTSQNSVP